MKLSTLARTLRTAVTFLCTAVLTYAASAAAGPLTLVKDGQPTSVIIVPAAPNPSALWGAKELQWHLKKITGADVPVVTDREQIDSDKVRIMVGESRATRSLGITAKGYQRQEYSLQAKANAIVLLGYDLNVDYPTLAAGTPDVFPKGRFGAAFQGWCAIGAKDHRFNDERGTMEAFVYVARTTNELGTGWMIFRVGDDQNGHNVQTVTDPGTERHHLVYRTFVNGQANEVAVREAWWNRAPGWHHLMATWDAAANKAEVFLDGKSVGTTSYAKTACADAPWFSVRGDPNNIPNCFGPIDEVRLSRVVRPPVVPQSPFQTDDDTTLLLHFDDADEIGRDASHFPRLNVAATLKHWSRTDHVILYEQEQGFKPPDRGSDRVGSLYAVYDFLEKCCGVRWYAPTEEGMVCPQTRTLTVTVKPLRRKPVFICRSATGSPGTWGLITPTDVHPNAKRELAGRLKQGGRGWLINHSLEGWPDRFWVKNPENPDAFEGEHHEYFYVNPDGSRSPSQICFSSPGALAQVIKDARAWFDQGKATVRAVANDDFYVVAPRDTPLYSCSCPDCKKGYELAGTDWPDTFNNGKASEIFYKFLNEVQEAIDQSNPGKHIASFNYMDYVYYPKTVAVNTSIYIGFAQCFGEVDPQSEKVMLECYEPWRTKMPGRNQVFIWRYDGWAWEHDEIRGQMPFPKWYPHKLAETLRMYADDGARGLFYCGLNRYIDGWLNIKLLDDPDLDVDYELNYFFSHYYGGAAEPMRQMYRMTEEAHTNYLNRPENSPEWWWCARPPLMENLGRLMEQARQKADTELVKKRVAAFERDIWQDLMLRGYNKYLDGQPNRKHPYPFMEPIPTVGERDMHPGDLPFFKGAFFRSGGPGIGVMGTGFDDQQGTMEAWVQVGPFIDNHYWHGNGLLFEIETRNGTSGHRVYLRPDFVKQVLIPTYEIWSGGQTHRVIGSPIAPPPADPQWHHIAACWDAKQGRRGAMSLFIDAQPSGRPAPYRATACKGRAFTAGWPSKSMSCFGAVDEIRLSNIVRRPALQTQRYKTDANTLLLLHFDEAQGQPATIMTDASLTKP